MTGSRGGAKKAHTFPLPPISKNFRGSTNVNLSHKSKQQAIAMPLSPLYFSEKGGSPLEASMDVSLPFELLSRVSEYLELGDLARLAVVQQSWHQVLYDSATTSDEQWELAQALLKGTNGLEANPSQALGLLRKLTKCETTENGLPVVENNTEKEFFSPAMEELAHCYLEGRPGINQNTTKGLEWLEASHTLGNSAEAAHEVALIYEYGQHGKEIDVVIAAEWLHKAAEGGHLEAMAELALCYELGCCGVEQSDELALQWYVKAANEGHLTSQFSVGEIYEEARGVPQSDEEACLWYYKAAVMGDEDSRKALQRLADIARILLPGVGALLNA